MIVFNNSYLKHGTVSTW